MAASEEPYYRYHVFFCINERSADHPRGSCARKGSTSMRRYMKEKAKALGRRDIRINAAQCLDRCEVGPALVIYPDAVWYRPLNQEDIDEILESHLGRGKIVERLRLRNEHNWPEDLE